MDEMTSYLTLKRAARRLGVHEQTLRTWERHGLIRMVRLPGSGHRRVPVAEIERLQGAMSATPTNSVRLVPPRQDPDSMTQARALAEVIRAELAYLDTTTNLDEFMLDSRGRTWSP
jgi:excisionase family DNA binding protein